jgi:hypothetical protein
VWQAGGSVRKPRVLTISPSTPLHHEELRRRPAQMSR